MVGIITIYDSDCSLADCECDWISYNDQLKEDSTYYTTADAISLTFEANADTSGTYTYSYYYSSDSMFSEKELSDSIQTGSAGPVDEDGNIRYHFDYTGEIKAGYYIISIDGPDGNRAFISVCQVVDA